MRSADGGWRWTDEDRETVSTTPDEPPAAVGSLEESAAAARVGSAEPASNDGTVAPPAPLRADAVLQGHRAGQPPLGLVLRWMTLGRVDLKAAAEAQRRRVAQVLTAIKDPPARVAVASAKGGVGKTTVSLALATVLGCHRSDRVVAVEANPHHGTYRERLSSHLQHERTVEDLLALIERSGHLAEIALPELH
ncbi:MAG TPA: AAA family ATPase, partial [Candidatus Dormibacteraeota bacterium]|nr:AAA family ATPase [Candidatus Dormibacteraeota bacterium]